MQLILDIFLYGKPYTACFLTEDSILFHNSYLSLQNLSELGLENAEQCEIPNTKIEKRICLVTNALFLKPFLGLCVRSEAYKTRVLNNLAENFGRFAILNLHLKLEPPDKEILDHAWCHRVQSLVWLRIELENAFSWLSTLGGAYSALGDYFEYCAEEAGRISKRQYKLSLMLGDDGLAARSKLYSAISYAQKGRLKLARHIVRDIVKFGIAIKDKRLVRMCHGVWSKLQYMRAVKNGTQTSNKGHGDQVENGRSIIV